VLTPRALERCCAADASSKLIRRPTRDAVGNGLRVATGAAFASGGGLVVESKSNRQELTFDRVTGETVVALEARAMSIAARASRSSSGQRCRRTL